MQNLGHSTHMEFWHNPKCSKSRDALAILESRGLSPKIFEYLVEPLNIQQVSNLLSKLGVSAIELARKRELSLLQISPLSENELIDAMVKHPILIERPILVVGNRAVIGRPPDRVLELLGGSDEII